MNKKRFLQLVGRQLAREASRPELDELAGLMENDTELKQLYQNLFATQASDTDEDRLDAEQAYATHFVKMQLNKQFEKVVAPVIQLKRKRKRYILLSAACVVLAIAGVWWYAPQSLSQYNIADAGAHKNEIVTKKGSKTSIRLPDGTQVWLNADSKISYPENFQGAATREVQLTGEAFFDVVKDKARPFIIHTRTIDIKVLGTAFNVRSYPDEKNTETSLVRGEIEVTLLSQPDKKIILKPKDKLSVSNNPDTAAVVAISGKSVTDSSNDRPVMTLGRMSYLNADTTYSTETLWLNNTLVFDGELFEKVASKIGKWYDKEVIIQDESLKKLRFTAVFDGESLEEVLEALRLTGGLFRYSINNQQVTIYSQNR